MEQVLYLGSYTKRESKGVHQIILDTDKKELRDYRLIAEVDSPTYLDLSADKETLYAISKTDEGGGITSFKKLKTEAMTRWLKFLLKDLRLAISTLLKTKN